MRSLIFLSSAMALLFYSIYVGEVGGTTAHGHAIVPRSELGALEMAMQSAGGRLTGVVVRGWVEVAGLADLERVEQSLGWDRTRLRSAEDRVLRIVPAQGRLFLSLTWTIGDAELHRWEARARLVRSAMMINGREPFVTVQLEGERRTADPAQLAEIASRALGGLSPQRWSDQRASSVAGQSPLLPMSAMGVNYQVAARRISDEVVKIWVGWPALNQEY